MIAATEMALVLLCIVIYIAFRLRSRSASAVDYKSSQARLNCIRLSARCFKWISLFTFAIVIFAAFTAIFMPDMVSAKEGFKIAPSLVARGPVLLAEIKPELHWLYPVFWLLAAAFVCRLIGFYYRLFGNIERGIFFDADNVRCIRCIGWWLVACPLIMICFEASKIIWAASSPDNPLRIMIKFDVIELLRGFFVIFISWIMDEGRKIQEEQELTV